MPCNMKKGYIQSIPMATKKPMCMNTAEKFFLKAKDKLEDVGMSAEKSIKKSKFEGYKVGY